MQSARSNAEEARRLGLKDNSPKAGQMPWIKDELYNNTLAVHDVLWRYVVTRFDNEKYCPVTVIGYGSIPIAIELSQWQYPVTYIAWSEKEAEQVRTDCAAQAGFLDKLLVLSPYRRIPKTRIVIFTGLLDVLTDKEVVRYLTMLADQSVFIVCAELTHSRDWKRLLENTFDVQGLWYNRKQYTFLELRRR